MPPHKGKPSPRFRVGKVTVYEHHGAWWAYYRDAGQSHRHKVADDRGQAEAVAAQVNAQLAQQGPTLLTFSPVSVAELRRQFLDYHEKVLHSAVGTLRRYRAATQHLEDFAARQPRLPQAHQVSPDGLAAYLRTIEVAPNGHRNAGRRKLRMKGVQFVLETCRSLYNYALKRRHLPPYVGNPFSELPLDRMKVRNKRELGWRVKTGQERVVPLLPEVVGVLRAVVGARKAGPVFLRERLAGRRPALTGDRRELALRERRAAEAKALTRDEEAALARKVWWDAGAIKPDVVRTSFVRASAEIDHPESTCPKSWWHTFATLLQDGNVDPLIRQQVMGHRPTVNGGLGITSKYTHTRPETLRQQVEQALRRWPESLRYALERAADRADR
jgi:site-specific recombinase XerD